MKSMLAPNETNARTGTSKIKQYGWELKDNPGELAWLHKTMLCVDHSYQRSSNHRKALGIAQKWSHTACGVIVVAKRTSDQRLYVIDGQHRVLAALKRDDIEKLPCIVFCSDGPKHEAAGFIDANTLRGMPNSQEKWRAQLMREDPSTTFVNDLVTQYGRTVSNSAGPTTVRCISALLRAAQTDRNALVRIWPLVSEISTGQVLHEVVFDGLMYLEMKITEGQSLTDKRWKERVVRVGYKELLAAAHKAAAYFARGGNKVWGTGMLEALNKGCRILIELSDD